MVFIKYHKEKVELDGSSIPRIKNPERLVKKLKKLGWTNLKWCPGNPLEDRRVSIILIGRPPNYKGEVSDYYEEAIKVLNKPENPGHDSGEVLVRDKLYGPIFDGNDGWSWY